VVIGKPDKWKNLMEEISERLGGKIKVLNWLDSEVEPEEIKKLCTCSVVIAEPNLITKKETQHALDNLQAKNKDVTYLPKIAEDILLRVPLQIASEFKEYYEMAFEMVSLDPKQRAFDVALSLITLPITLTLGIIISIMIFIDSGMPIIFKQRRIGLNGKPFTLHKFRSMSNAPKKEMGFADDHASYITRVGKILRKFRIDEIPQIWDVLRGEMSIIGPRPEQPEFEAQFAESIPFYKYRRKLKPGITGWAQVNFSYAADLEETAKKLEYDLYYVKNRNIMLDLQITLRTAEIMLLMRGAK
jgi:lipopolysaccharide/colanic/teichoic acid biosynthesis glycosyltransferase